MPEARGCPAARGSPTSPARPLGTQHAVASGTRRRAGLLSCVLGQTKPRLSPPQPHMREASGHRRHPREHCPRGTAGQEGAARAGCPPRALPCRVPPAGWGRSPVASPTVPGGPCSPGPPSQAGLSSAAALQPPAMLQPAGTKGARLRASSCCPTHFFLGGWSQLSSAPAGVTAGTSEPAGALPAPPALLQPRCRLGKVGGSGGCQEQRGAAQPASAPAAPLRGLISVSAAREGNLGKYAPPVLGCAEHRSPAPCTIQLLPRGRSLLSACPLRGSRRGAKPPSVFAGGGRDGCSPRERG